MGKIKQEFIEEQKVNPPKPPAANQQNQPEFKIKIAVDGILEKFDCPICMCKLEEPMITKCGHTFCKECIAEAVNRTHDCPLCNGALQQTDVFRNYSLESLLKLFEQKKEEETQKYFDELAQNAIKVESENIQGVDAHGDAVMQIDSSSKEEYSSIETIFTLNLKESLLKFQKYQQEIMGERDAIIDKIKRKYSAFGGNQISEKDSEIKCVIEKYDRAQSILMQQYDHHMKQILPNPQLLPIRLNVVLQRSGDGPDFDEIFHNNVFQVKPYETVDGLIGQIKDFYDQKQNSIKLFQLEQIIISGPLCDSIEVLQGCLTPVGASNQAVVMDNTRSFSELGVTMQNTKVVLKGKILFKSDAPLECLTLKYKKDDPEETKYNYYSCKACNVNWICEWCKEGCHSGHEVLPHILDHRPTWACCFCVKKGHCKIKNSKNSKSK